MNSYEHTSRDFLPLPVIRSACAGDTDAVEQVLQHYRGYINKLCTGILYDKHGQPHVCITGLRNWYSQSRKANSKGMGSSFWAVKERTFYTI